MGSSGGEAGTADGNAEAMDERRALIVINRHGRKAKQSIDGGLRLLEEAGIEAEVHFVRRPERIPNIIVDHGRHVDLVLIGGGDGTLSQSIEPMLEIGKPLGILPMGNANDLARTLGINSTPEDGCRVVAGGTIRRIDLGWVNGKHFFNVASMGVSVGIAKRLTGEFKRRWGILGYAVCAWEALESHKTFNATIRCGNEVHEVKAIQIAVGNGRYYGGGMTIAEDATIDDGRLDLYALAPAPLWRLLVLVPALRWGKHGKAENVHCLHGSAIEVETDRPLPINVDGEILTETPAEFRVERQALPVFVP